MRYILVLIGMLFTATAQAQYLTPAVNSPLFPSTPSAKFVPKASSGSAADWAQLACSDLSNASAFCSGTSAVNLTGTLQAAQFPALTGDVTTSAGALATTIAANAVTNAKMATMNAWTIKMNNTSGAAVPTDTTIDGLTLKASPTTSDEIPIWDAAASAMKKTTFPSGTGTVTSVASGTGLSGGPITTSGTLARAYNEATFTTAPSNPTGTSSASFLMMGLGSSCKITPTNSGRLIVVFAANISASGASAIVPSFEGQYGTGSAPTNGAAASGTTFDGPRASTVATSGSFNSITMYGLITGLALSTQVWLDFAINSDGTHTASLSNIRCTATEF